MKRFIAVFTLVAFIFNFSFVSFSYADIIDDLLEAEPIAPSINSTTDSEEGSVSNLPEFVNDTEPDSNWIMDQLLPWFASILNSLAKPFVWLALQIPAVEECILNTTPYFKITLFENKTTSNASSLTTSLQSSVSAIYNAFRYLVTAVYIVILVYLAIRMLLSSVGRQKALYKDLIKHWIVGLLLLFSFHWVMAGIIWLCNEIVGILATFTTGILDQYTSELDKAAAGEKLFDAKIGVAPVTLTILHNCTASAADFSGWGWLAAFLMPLVKIILCFFLMGSAISILFTYLKRMFTIILLVLVFPLVALSYVFDKIGDRKAQTFSIWLKEFTVNVMIQPLHAIIMVFIATLLSTSFSPGVGKELFGPSIIGAVLSVALLRLIPVGEKLLKQLFQITSSMGPGADGIAGSMAKAGFAISGARQSIGNLGKIAKKPFDIAKLRRANKDVESDAKKQARIAKKDAKLAAISKGESGAEARKAGRLAARNSLANNRLYQDYKNKLQDTYGSKTAMGAMLKANAALGSASLAAGTALTGSDKFFSEASTRAILAADFTTGVLNIPGNAVNSILGNKTNSRSFDQWSNELKNKEDIELMSSAKKKDLAKKLGVPPEFITKDNFPRIKKALQLGTQLSKFSKDPVKPEDLASTLGFNYETEAVKSGIDPFAKNRKLDPKNWNVVQTKNGTFLQSTDEKHKDRMILIGAGDSSMAEGEMRTLSTLSSHGSHEEHRNKVIGMLRASGNHEVIELEQKIEAVPGKITAAENNITAAENRIKVANEEIKAADKKIASANDIIHDPSSSDADKARAESERDKAMDSRTDANNEKEAAIKARENAIKDRESASKSRKDSIEKLDKIADTEIKKYQTIDNSGYSEIFGQSYFSSPDDARAQAFPFGVDIPEDISNSESDTLHIIMDDDGLHYRVSEIRGKRFALSEEEPELSGENIKIKRNKDGQWIIEK